MNPFDIFLPIWVPLLESIEWGMIELAKFTGSGGLAIILFTVALKIVLLPLSVIQTRSMKAMQTMQPELAELRKKYGKDRERFAQEQMRLYKERGFNPAAGCLPMLPMMFVLIGLYQALVQLSCDPATATTSNCDPTRSDPHFYESWLWIANLGRPDIPFHIFGNVPIPGVLPVVMLITQFAYGRMTPTSGSSDDPQQRMMQQMTTYFMPLMLFVFSFNFPAGLVLYWVVSNVFEIVRMGFSMGWEPLKPSSLMDSFSGLSLAGILGASSGSSDSKVASPDKRTPSEDAINPAPNPPPGGSRRKKGKRGGKR
ncbi:MAG: YidC/Oxa1 family membrane protein insertase [Chloroflexota bacterium]